MRRLPISPLLAPPFGCGLPWWPFCLGFEQIWGNFDFQPHCPTRTGAEKRPCMRDLVPKYRFFEAQRPFEHLNRTFPSKSNLVCTRVGYFDAVGAGRAAPWGPLRGRQGVGIDQDYGANAQQGAPTRAVRGRPGARPSWTGRRRPGLTPRPARPRTTRACADAAREAYALQLGRAGVGTAQTGASGSAFACLRSLCHWGPPHAAHRHRIPPARADWKTCFLEHTLARIPAALGGQRNMYRGAGGSR